MGTRKQGRQFPRRETIRSKNKSRGRHVVFAPRVRTLGNAIGSDALRACRVQRGGKPGPTMERWKWHRRHAGTDISQEDRFSWDTEVCRFNHRTLRILQAAWANVICNPAFCRRCGKMIMLLLLALC